MTRTICLAVALATITSLSHAQEPAADPAPEEARELITAPGVTAYQAGDDQKALALFEEAYRRAPLPRIALWRARALARVGRLLDAEAALTELDAMKPPAIAQAHARATAEGLAVAPLDDQLKARDAAAEERAEVAARIPTLTALAEGVDGARVTVNGQPVGTPAVRHDPGRFRIEATHPDGRVEVRTILLAERDRATVRLAFATTADPVDRDATQRTVGFIAIGVGSAAAVVGTVIGAVAIAKLESADCPEDTCPPEQFEEADDYNALRLPSGISIVAGGLLAALGVGLLISADDPDVGEVGALIGPGYLGVRGSF